MGKGEYIMNYIFKTKTTMKDYNCKKKWFIGTDSVPEMYKRGHRGARPVGLS